MIKGDKYFKTDNFLCAAYLLAKGIDLYNLEPWDSFESKFVFCFIETEEVQDLVADFFDLQAKVRPQDLANAQRNLRSILYQRKSIYKES